MAAENLDKKYQTVLEYADIFIEKTLDNFENLSETTDKQFAIMVLQASATWLLLMTCKLEYERRGYKGLEEIVGGISDAVREALTDCKPTTH